MITEEEKRQTPLTVFLSACSIDALLLKLPHNSSSSHLGVRVALAEEVKLGQTGGVHHPQPAIT